MSNKKMSSRRFGQMIKIRPERKKEYVRHHAAVWPEILRKIRQCNIRNYSIFLKDDFLFAYFEYVGDDFDGDMARMAADSKTQEWWKLMKPMQKTIPTRGKGEWWADMQEVFHTD